MATAMDVGAQPITSFLFTWTAMTAVMMAPSVAPFVVSFARRLERRWPATVLLAAAYLIVWSGFGVAVHYAWPWVTYVPAGVAIAFIGLYAFTPLMRVGQARCIAMCRRHDAIEEHALGGAIREGLSYGLSCVACSGGVMLALVVLGMSNIVLMIAGAGLILLYKLAGTWPRRLDVALSTVFLLGGTWLVAV